MKKVLFVALESELPWQLLPADVDVYYTGVGKVNASIVATSLLNWYDADDTLVINYGSAGGSTELLNRLIKCTRFAQGDIDCSPIYNKGITPFDKYGWDTQTIDFGGGGELVTSYDQFQLYPENIVDMEAYAIAKVCKIFDFKFICYKWISDDGSPADFLENHSKGIPYFLEELTKI